MSDIIVRRPIERRTMQRFYEQFRRRGTAASRSNRRCTFRFRKVDDTSARLVRRDTASLLQYGNGVYSRAWTASCMVSLLPPPGSIIQKIYPQSAKVGQFFRIDRGYQNNEGSLYPCLVFSPTPYTNCSTSSRSGRQRSPINGSPEFQ